VFLKFEVWGLWVGWQHVDFGSTYTKGLGQGDCPKPFLIDLIWVG
jgi:hypothetical protein